jgi:hypothetical protein
MFRLVAIKSAKRHRSRTQRSRPNARFRRKAATPHRVWGKLPIRMEPVPEGGAVGGAVSLKTLNFRRIKQGATGITTVAPCVHRSMGQGGNNRL